MAVDQFSVRFSGDVSSADGPISIGDVLIPNSGGTSLVIATTANRAGRRAECIARTQLGSGRTGPVQPQYAGMIPASVSGLAAGSQQLVRTSSAGRIERVSSYTSGDDIIGYAEADGRVHLMMGLPIAEIIAAAGGGGGGAPVGASYVTLGTDATLTSERVLTAGTGITLTDAGAGSTLTVATTAETNAAANVGAGTGTIYRDKTGATLNLKTLVAGSNVTITNGTNDVTIAASGGGGGTPGGSTTQFQYNSSGSFAGSSGLVYDGTNNQPQAPNGYAITNAGIRMVLAGFPTSSTKTITFPNATGTVVLTDTVDNLSNKTIVAANNTITDTSTAAGDLFKSNGTKFVRFAKGSASQLLRVNAGGTDIEWATYTILAVAGSTSEIQVNSGSSTLAAATNVTAGSGYIAIGASVGTTGALRFPLGSSSVLIGGKAGAGTNDQIVGSSGFHLYFGEVTPSNWSTHISGDPVDIWSKSTFVVYYGAGSTGFTLNTAPNASFFGAGSFGSRTKTIHIADGTEDCTHTPTGGGLLYSLGGAGKWKGTSGTNTTFAAADPHCDKCGRDFAHEWFNGVHDEYLMVCMPCMLGALESLGINVAAFSRRQLHQ